MNLALLADQHAAHERALHAEGRWHSWGEVRRRAAAVAGALAALDVAPGDRVAIVWPTSVDFVVAYLGVLAAGAVAVPLNPNSPPAELGRELDVVEPQAVLAGARFEVISAAPHTVLPQAVIDAGGAPAGSVAWEKVSGAAAAKSADAAGAAGAAGAATPVAGDADDAGDDDAGDDDAGDDDAGDGPAAEAASDAASGASGSEAREGDSLLHPAYRDESDLAVLLFTSGTAGEPKAAMLTHANLTANLRQMLAIPEILRGDDIGLVALPLFHVFGLNVALGLSLATGAALVLDTRFDAVTTLDQVRDLGVTTLLGVPTMFGAWADVAGGGANGNSALAGVRRAISGAAALDADVAVRFERRYGIEIWQGYGLTESSPAVSTSFGTGRNRPGSVGRPLPGVEVQLVDEEDEPVLEGDTGEIWVRGDNVFAGYWRDAEATALVLTEDGWLRTGDIGVIGEDGDLFVVDRSKDLIIVSGFNVFPGEVERVVASAPGVAEVAVIGRPDPDTGEAVEAVIVVEDGAVVTEELVRAYCGANLTRYKCPTSIRFVDALPRGLVGKALRRALRDQLG